MQSSLSLVAASELVTESVVVGDYCSSPGTAMTLIPEARRLASYWRKRSRGGALDAVVVMGLDGKRAQVLEQALAASLGQVRTLCLPEPESSVPGEVHALAACAASGVLVQALPLATPKSGRALLGLGAALIAVIGLAGISVRSSVRSELEHWDGQIADLERSRADLVLAEQDARDVDWATARLRAVSERLEATRTWGLPFEQLVDDAFQAAAGAATWLALDLARSDDGYDVTLQGVTEGDPLRSWSELERITGELERSSCFDRVALVPPTLSPSALNPNGLLSFKLEAQVEGFAFDPRPLANRAAAETWSREAARQLSCASEGSWRLGPRSGGARYVRLGGCHPSNGVRRPSPRGRSRGHARRGPAPARRLGIESRHFSRREASSNSANRSRRCGALYPASSR